MTGRTLLVAIFMLVGARQAHAQLRFSGDAPKVYSIQPREHRFLHGVHVGAGVLPINAYYVGLAVSAGYTYNFNDLWAWEVLNGFYAFDFSTSLKSNLLAEAGAAPAESATLQVDGMLSSNVIIKPLFGKIAIFNRAAVQAETYFTLGMGVVHASQSGGQQSGFGPAPDVGIGFDFWLSHRWAMRLDVRDYIAFLAGDVNNILLLSLGISFNFLEPDAADALLGMR